MYRNETWNVRTGRGERPGYYFSTVLLCGLDYCEMYEPGGSGKGFAVVVLLPASDCVRVEGWSQYVSGRKTRNPLTSMGSCVCACACACACVWVYTWCVYGKKNSRLSLVDITFIFSLRKHGGVNNRLSLFSDECIRARVRRVIIVRFIFPTPSPPPGQDYYIPSCIAV